MATDVNVFLKLSADEVMVCYNLKRGQWVQMDCLEVQNCNLLISNRKVEEVL